MFHNQRDTEDKQELWENGSFRTGRTDPPKSHRGLIAVLMVALIFLGGIVSVLSILNIRLFQKLQEGDPEETAFFHFEETQSTAPGESDASEDATAPSNQAGSVQLQLQQTPESVENIPQVGGLSLQQIYAGAIDSVVSVSCTTRSGVSTGTGVVLSADGYVVTNAHVIESARSIEILCNSSDTYAATLVGKDEVSDLAVLRVQNVRLKPATFGDSTALRVGDSVVAIGDPLGTELRGTMTDGIVSAINRDITTGGRTMTLIQTNAALNAGNSGGPLLNCHGQVIGINTMKIGDYVSSAGVEGLGFAIPSTTVKEVVDQLIAKGYVSGRPSLGLTGAAVSAFDQHYYRIPKGIYVTAVTEGSDAADKGIVPGDIILQLDGVRITDEDALNTFLYSHKAGDTVSAVIYRSGTQYSLRLTLGQVQ